jgi:hypothetical protein
MVGGTCILHYCSQAVFLMKGNPLYDQDPNFF